MSTGVLRAVSIGGGTGQPKLIGALRRMGAHIDSVVAMADDGGSTGLLREREHVVPPGDVRKCLSALAADADAPLARAFAHRFASIEDHALGNLLLVALAKETGSFVEAIGACEDLLGCVGHVHPSTLDCVHLAGQTSGGRTVHGQARISYGAEPFSRVWLEPAEAEANERAVEAILAADLVVLGPGSLFTSIIPNVLVRGIRDALRATRATCAFVCPKIDSLGETSGFSAADHVEALAAHGLEGAIDVVLVHRSERAEFVYPYARVRSREAFGCRADEPLNSATCLSSGEDGAASVVSAREIAAAKDAPFGPIRASGDDIARIKSLCGRVIVRDFTGAGSPAVHDEERLALALAEAVA